MNRDDAKQPERSIVMGIHSCNMSTNMSADDLAKFKSCISPSQIDSFLRQALQMLWMMLPKEQQTPEIIEAEFRRLVERALRDFSEDAARFGGGRPGS